MSQKGSMVFWIDNAVVFNYMQISERNSLIIAKKKERKGDNTQNV